MTRPISELEAPFAVALDVHSFGMTDELFSQLCRDNEDLRLELSAEGELIIMAPTVGTTGSRNANVISQVTVWAKKNGTGISFDSSTMFCLPNGAKRSLDAAWGGARDGLRSPKPSERASFLFALILCWTCVRRLTAYDSYKIRCRSTFRMERN